MQTMKNSKKILTDDEKIEKAKLILDDHQQGNTNYEIIPMSDVEETKMKWMVKEVFAYGKFSAIVGDPGIGKSLWGARILSCLSTGKTIFGSDGGEIGDSIIISPEDDGGDTLRPRLEACGADLRRIHFFKKIELKYKIPTHIQYLEAIKRYAEEIRIRRHTLRLIFIDPLEEVLGDINLNKSIKVRKALSPFIDYCADQEIALLGILHLNKTDKKAIYKISGSMGFPAIARSVYMVVRDPQNSDMRLFLSVKNNYADDIKGFRCSIVTNQDDIPFVEFHEVIYEDIDDVLLMGREKEERIPAPRKVILEYLKSIFPLPIKQKDLAMALQRKANTVCQLLKKLQADNFVEQDNNGMYKYVPKSIAPLDSSDSVNSANNNSTEGEEK